MKFSEEDMEFFEYGGNVLDNEELKVKTRQTCRKLTNKTLLMCVLYQLRNNNPWHTFADLKFVNVSYQTIYKRFTKLRKQE